ARALERTADGDAAHEVTRADGAGSEVGDAHAPAPTVVPPAKILSDFWRRFAAGFARAVLSLSTGLRPNTSACFTREIANATQRRAGDRWAVLMPHGSHA